MGDYCFLPMVIGDRGVVPGGWRWYPELRGDLCPRHARREGLGHRSGEEIIGLVATGDGSVTVSVHANIRPGPLDGHELSEPSP